MQERQSLVVSETMLKLLFDRFESSSCREAEAVIDLNKAIVLLLKTIGNNPEETLRVVTNLKESFEELEKEINNNSTKNTAIETMCKVTTDLVSKIDKRMWKFYVAIMVTFTLGAVLLGYLVNLKLLLNTLIQGM